MVKLYFSMSFIEPPSETLRLVPVGGFAEPLIQAFFIEQAVLGADFLDHAHRVDWGPLQGTFDVIALDKRSDEGRGEGVAGTGSLERRSWVRVKWHLEALIAV
jgi:hypothetical protein